MTQAAVVIGIDDVDESESEDELVEETSVQEEAPRQVEEISPREIEDKFPRVIIGEAVDELMQTGGSHTSYVTTTTESQGSKKTVIHVQEEVLVQQESDSEWDSEDVSFLGLGVYCL